MPRPATLYAEPFADAYVTEGAKMPSETQEARYLNRLVQAYPIHPEVFDRLYEDWTTLPKFPTNARGPETDGQGDLPAMEGSKSGSDDSAWQSAAL